MSRRHRLHDHAVAAGLFVSAASAFAVGTACDNRPVAPLDRDDAGADAGEEAEAPPPPPPVELGRHAVQIVETRRVVPSPGLPAGAPVLNSNNNLDVVRFEGRVYLAWRTAPDHFASDKTLIVVVSSEDEVTWRLERTFTAATDLREPRLLVLKGSLLLYVSRLGTDPLKFEPQGVSLSRRGRDGAWSELEDVQRSADGDAGAPAPMTGYVAWRTKVDRGMPFMSAYRGGEHIYRFDGLPLDVELLTTDDGVTWRGVDPARPVVSRGGGSEMDFTRTDDGTLYAIVRNEAGDATGFGSKVCRAAASDLATWRCASDPKKYDSPLVFWHDGEAYLVGRRNVSPTGSYDLGTRDANLQQSAIAFQLDYRRHAKRCALWRFVPSPDGAPPRIGYVLDLPSRGDTCFAARIETSAAGDLAIYDYSSDVEGKDVSWAEGQAGPTYVYRHLVRFTRR